jgi:hypothetical protein
MSPGSKVGFGAALQHIGKGLMQYTQLSVEDQRQKNLDAIRASERGEDIAHRTAREGVADTQFNVAIGAKADAASAAAINESKSDDKKHQQQKELARLNNASQAAISAARSAAELAGKTGNIVSSADRGKLAIELVKTLQNDPANYDVPVSVLVKQSKELIDSLYPGGGQPSPSQTPAKPAQPKKDPTGFTIPVGVNGKPLF